MNFPRPFATRLLLSLTLLGSFACEHNASPSPTAPPGGSHDDTQSAPAGEARAEPGGAQLGLVFLGDSLSAGLHLPGDQAFPAVLGRRLEARGLALTLLNAGVSGDTSAGALRRLDWILKAEPDVVVVEIGANDGMRGQPTEELEANLRAILERLESRGVVPILLGMRLPLSYGAEYTEAFAAVYPRVAQDLDVAFVPNWMRGVGGVPQMNLADGLHPTSEGHERLASNIEPTLVDVLDAVAKRRQGSR